MKNNRSHTPFNHRFDNESERRRKHNTRKSVRDRSPLGCVFRTDRDRELAFTRTTPTPLVFSIINNRRLAPRLLASNHGKGGGWSGWIYTRHNARFHSVVTLRFRFGFSLCRLLLELTRPRTKDAFLSRLHQTGAAARPWEKGEIVWGKRERVRVISSRP